MATTLTVFCLCYLLFTEGFRQEAELRVVSSKIFWILVLYSCNNGFMVTDKSCPGNLWVQKLSLYLAFQVGLWVLYVQVFPM